MKKNGKWIILAIVLIVVAFFANRLINTPAEAACTGCGEGGHGACIEAPGHTHDDEVGHEHEEGVWLDHKHEKK